MAGAILSLGKPAVFCTVYDAIPNLGDAARSALAAFNDVILRAAFRNHATVIDLRLVCDEEVDYLAASPIEPSSRGGAKIARLITDVAARNAFPSDRSVVYP